VSQSYNLVILVDGNIGDGVGKEDTVLKRKSMAGAKWREM
jgi:hypothetical protein